MSLGTPENSAIQKLSIIIIIILHAVHVVHVTQANGSEAADKSVRCYRLILPCQRIYRPLLMPLPSKYRLEEMLSEHTTFTLKTSCV